MNASDFSRSRLTDATASSTFEPAMNRRARCSAFHLAAFASSRPPRPCGGQHPDAVAHPPRDRVAGLAEVLAQVAGDGRRVVQPGQGVDEAEELDLERLGAHGPVHEQLVDPGRGEGRRALPLDPGEDLLAVRPSVRCSRSRGRGHVASLYESPKPLSILPRFRRHGGRLVATISSIGKFQVLGTLGKGAHSTILHVRRAADSREYALKVVPVDETDEQKFLEQAKHEFRVAQMLGHPNLIKIYCLELKRDWLFRVKKAEVLIEYVNGKTLDAIPIPQDQLVVVFAQIAAGLAHMHRRGVFHADLKPNNILYGKRGEVKIIDYGLAWIKGEPKDRVQGTPEYMAPETAQEQGDQRADRHLQPRRHHVPADDPEAAAERRARRPNRCGSDVKAFASMLTPVGELNKAVPKALCDVIHKCLAYDPEKRPERVGEVLDDLKQIAADMTPISRSAIDGDRWPYWTGNTSSPLRVTDLVDFLADGKGAKVDPNPSRRTTRLPFDLSPTGSSSISTATFHVRFRHIKDAYAPFDPDAIRSASSSPVRRTKTGPSIGCSTNSRDLLEKANYKELTQPEAVQVMQGAHATGGSSWTWTGRVFDHIEMYYRGDTFGPGPFAGGGNCGSWKRRSFPSSTGWSSSSSRQPHKRLGKSGRHEVSVHEDFQGHAEAGPGDGPPGHADPADQMGQGADLLSRHVRVRGRALQVPVGHGSASATSSPSAGRSRCRGASPRCSPGTGTSPSSATPARRLRTTFS